MSSWLQAVPEGLDALYEPVYVLMGEGGVEERELEHHPSVLHRLSDDRSARQERAPHGPVHFVSVTEREDDRAEGGGDRTDEVLVPADHRVEVVRVSDDRVDHPFIAVASMRHEADEHLERIGASGGLDRLVHEIDVSVLLVLLPVQVVGVQLEAAQKGCVLHEYGGAADGKEEHLVEVDGER